jgi:hypothetical protein
MLTKQQIDQVFRMAEQSRLDAEEKKRKQKAKTKWISKARLASKSEVRHACHVCGKHKSIAHGHHIEPLYKQFEKDTFNPEVVWLCPNHHAAVHLFLDRKALDAWPDMSDFSEEENENILKVALKGIK